MDKKTSLWIVITIAAVLLTLFLEKFAVGAHVFELLRNHRDDGLGALLYQHGKAISRITTLSIIMFAVFFVRRWREYLALYLQHFKPQQLLFLPLQILVFITFYGLAPIALPAMNEANGLVQALWLALGFGLAILALLTLAHYRFWGQLIQREKWFLLLAVLLSTAVWVFGLYTQNLWQSMSEVTFSLVEKTLGWMGFEVFADADAKVIGIDDFLVNIAPACSGYEGIGLITAFCCVYLYSFKSEFRFPRSLLLIPIGAVVIWCFNILRIDLLILIGAKWSTDVAVQGFHTQAGWITFIITSVLVMLAAHKIPWFTHHHARPQTTVKPPINIASATLLPLIVLLAATFVTQALSGGFDWLYPLRVIATIICLAYCWQALDLRPLHLSYRGGLAVGAGLVVAVLWYFMVSPSEEINHNYGEAFAHNSPVVIGAWLVFRFIGSVITVPIAEELGFRAYLLCRAGKQEVITRGTIPFSWLSFAVSGVAFGALHGDWVAGVVAGLAYALVRYKSQHIGDAILAHAVTNLSLFLVAGMTGSWYLL